MIGADLTTLGNRDEPRRYREGVRPGFQAHRGRPEIDGLEQGVEILHCQHPTPVAGTEPYPQRLDASLEVPANQLTADGRARVVVALPDLPPAKRSSTSKKRKDPREACRRYAIEIVGRVEGLE
jgi:hypothetical protein